MTKFRKLHAHNGIKKRVGNDDIYLALLFPVLASLASHLFRLNYISTILVFCVPFAVWLTAKARGIFLKTAIFSFFVSIPFITIIEYIAVVDKQWFVPFSVFPIRVLGVVPIEDLLGGFLHVYSVIAFYEYFFDAHPREIIRNKMKYLLVPLFISLFLVIVLIKIVPSILYIPYAYFWLGVCFLLAPVLIFFSTYPKLFVKITKTTLYFFVFLLFFEITGVALGHWTFPGMEFIGLIRFVGLTIPLEEFAFFLVVSTYTILCVYEYFDDDTK
jgi:hypothetical protein